MINSIKNSFTRFFKNLKEGVKPKNIKTKINEMPRMNQVYWSKLIVGITVGLIFGLTNFTNWPAGLTLLLIYIALSVGWFLHLRNEDSGIKIRQYFTSAIFQYFITAIAVWALLWNVIYVPGSHFSYLNYPQDKINNFLLISPEDLIEKMTSKILAII